MTLDQKIKVCIRGMSGLLGSRLALAISKQPDMEVAAGIAVNDRSLQRLLNGILRGKMPDLMYLDEPHKTVRELNERHSTNFMPADQANLSRICDIVVDCTSPGNRGKWDQRYHHFGKPVILQSGEYPAGMLIAPPLIESADSNANIYRQGDCILSGISPLLSALGPVIKSVRLHILMQYGQHLNDYPTCQAVNSTYLRDDLALQIKDELSRLFKGAGIFMEGVLQVPGLDYYTATMHLDTTTALNGGDIRKILSAHPRVMVSPTGITSTYHIDHLLREESRALGFDIPPIVVYGNDLDFKQPKKNDIRMRSTIYSKLVAVLPNIDSIRILSSGMDPLEAMRLTDRYFSFICQ